MEHVWRTMFDKATAGYPPEQKEALEQDLCPSCYAKGLAVPCRILTTFYHEGLDMNVHHIRCMDTFRCEWDGYIPTVRKESGLENFFRS